MFNQEGDLDQFVDILIKNPPATQSSIQLQFDNIKLYQLFDNLLYIFTNICKKKYNNDNGKVDIDKLSSHEINNIISYFQSFGIKLIINIYDIENYKNYSQYIEKNTSILFNNESDNLKHMLYKIYIKNKILIISFDFL
tara:strand:+ start:310 stop:726 length:417 start_codon:yes stop_codon:yes gene_type:complete